ncbi:MAG: pyridoxamine 5'-phosphate oxidase family protein [Candidatus Helarchaeota archaeon]
MSTTIQIIDKLAEEDIPEFLPDMMIKVLATVDENNKPNLVFINTFEAKDNKTLMFAEFIHGKSKKYLELNPKCAVNFLTLEYRNWLVKGDFNHWEYDGKYYEYYNNEKALFRNNAYTGITRVGFIDIKKVIAPRTAIKLDRKKMKLIKNFIKEGKADNNRPQIIPNMVDKIFKAKSNLKFISYIDDDGYPFIIPTLELMSVNNNRFVFTPTILKDEFLKLKPGTFMACYGMSLEIMMYQVRGTFQGIHEYEGIPIGILDIEEVYCSMPPKAGDRIV